MYLAYKSSGANIDARYCVGKNLCMGFFQAVQIFSILELVQLQVRLQYKAEQYVLTLSSYINIQHHTYV